LWVKPKRSRFSVVVDVPVFAYCAYAYHGLLSVMRRFTAVVPATGPGVISTSMRRPGWREISAA
jgi:hypothetical protein